MNSLTELSHQVDSELSDLALGTKETQKAIKSLKEMKIKVNRTILVSDIQTCLSLCSKASSTLDLSKSLISVISEYCARCVVPTPGEFIYFPRNHFQSVSRFADLLQNGLFKFDN